MENPFELLVSGQADWDSDIIANWFVADRGFHVTERAGQAISSGQILSLNSGGFFFPFNPNSSGAQPHGMAYTAAASGDSMSVIVWGAIRSLSINSPAIPGQLMFSNASGFLSTTTLGLPVGYGLKGYGVLFNPAKPATGLGSISLAKLTDVNTNGVSDGKALAWSDASSRWVPTTFVGSGGAVSLAALSDVNTNGVSNGKVLQWADASSKWVPASLGGATFALPSMTILQRSSVQSFATGTTTDISWDTTVIQDDVSAFSASSPTIISVKSGYTRVRITVHLAWATNNNNERYVDLQVNGSTIDTNWYKGASEGSHCFVTRWHTVASGDLLKIRAFQNTGGNLNLGGGGAGYGWPYVQAEWAP